MKIKYFVKNYKPSDNFKEVLEKKVYKLEKYFDDDAECKINLIEDNNKFRLEVTISASGSFFRSDVVSNDMYNNIDIALPKIERQIIKHADKFRSKLKKDAFKVEELLFLEEKPMEVIAGIVKTKQFDLTPITVEDAIAQMEALDHNFYIFYNVVTHKVSVVYRRADGANGLIEVSY